MRSVGRGKSYIKDFNPNSPLNPEPEGEADLQIVIDQPEFRRPGARIPFLTDCDRLSKPRSVP